MKRKKQNGKLKKHDRLPTNEMTSDAYVQKDVGTSTILSEPPPGLKLPNLRLNLMHDIGNEKS